MKGNLYLGASSRPVFGVAVDASCIGESDRGEYFHGRVEWQAKCLETGKPIFKSHVRRFGTVNIAELMAIVDAVSLLHQNGLHDVPVYSDSLTAIAWYRNGKHKSKMPHNRDTAPNIALMQHAFLWINENKPTNPVLKWRTDLWGEIPADYGRK